MHSCDLINDENYNREYRRLRTLTSQTDIVEGSVSKKILFFDNYHWLSIRTRNNLRRKLKHYLVFISKYDASYIIRYVQICQSQISKILFRL